VRTAILCAAIAAVFFAGCKDDKPATEATPAAPEAAPAPEAEAPPELVDDVVPVQEDFEEAAAGEITPENYTAQLEALDKEIAEDEAKAGPQQ
jgi:hypothetical protein